MSGLDDEGIHPAGRKPTFVPVSIVSSSALHTQKSMLLCVVERGVQLVLTLYQFPGDRKKDSPAGRGEGRVARVQLHLWHPFLLPSRMAAKTSLGPPQGFLSQ